MKIIQWILSILTSFILLQTLYFKFSGSEESIYIFTKIGMEPWGRYGSGIVELIAAVLLLIPTTRVYGAVLALGVICGALFFHFTSLDIEVMDDGGQLFVYALVVFASSILLIIFNREQLIQMTNRFIRKNG